MNYRTVKDIAVTTEGFIYRFFPPCSALVPYVAEHPYFFFGLLPVIEFVKMMWYYSHKSQLPENTDEDLTKSQIKFYYASKTVVAFFAIACMVLAAAGIAPTALTFASSGGFMYLLTISTLRYGKKAWRDHQNNGPDHKQFKNTLITVLLMGVTAGLGLMFFSPMFQLGWSILMGSHVMMVSVIGYKMGIQNASQKATPSERFFYTLRAAMVLAGFTLILAAPSLSALGVPVGTALTFVGLISASIKEYSDIADKVFKPNDTLDMSPFATVSELSPRSSVALSFSVTPTHSLADSLEAWDGSNPRSSATSFRN